MRVTLGESDETFIHQKVSRVAGYLVRRFQFPPEGREDLRHDLLVDLLDRFKDFDPTRGSVKSFAGVVIHHAASRIAARIHRERSLFAPISLDSLVKEDGTTTFGETILEEDAYLAWLGSEANQLATLERQLDLESVLATLSPTHRALCVDLLTGSGGCGGPEHGPSRATRYRRLNDVRLRLLAAGLGPRRETVGHSNEYSLIMDINSQGPVHGITEVELCAWFGQADRGQKLIYYRGSLAYDLSDTASTLTRRERAELARVARRAKAFADTGLVDLVQQRLGRDDFAYILIVRRRPNHAERSDSPRRLPQSADF